MRAPNADIFHQTVTLCFEEVLKSVGPGVKDTVYFFLGKKQISKHDVSTQFLDVEKTLTEIFGAGGSAMLIATLLKLAEEYSMSLNLSYAESSSQKLDQLRERIMVERRLPKHYRKNLDTVSFEDQSGITAPWSE